MRVFTRTSRRFCSKLNLNFTKFLLRVSSVREQIKRHVYPTNPVIFSDADWDLHWLCCPATLNTNMVAVTTAQVKWLLQLLQQLCLALEACLVSANDMLESFGGVPVCLVATCNRDRSRVMYPHTWSAHVHILLLVLRPEIPRFWPFLPDSTLLTLLKILQKCLYVAYYVPSPFNDISYKVHRGLPSRRAVTVLRKVNSLQVITTNLQTHCLTTMAERALWYLQSFKESREVVLIINYDNNRKLINMNNTDLPSLKLAFTHFQTLTWHIVQLLII